MNCSLLIKQSIDNMTEAEKKIAEYILNNNCEIYRLSAAELASYAGTSGASVIRFVKKIGFEGFQEFKIALAKNDVEERDDKTDYDYIDTNDTVKEIISKTGRSNIKTIEDTLALLNEKHVIQAIEAIQNAKNIYLFGVGASALIAMDFQYKLVRINRNAHMHLDSHMQLSMAAHIESEDLAIAISYTGKTKEIYSALLKAKERNAKCISITKYGTNPIASISDIKLQVPSIEKDLRVGAISSRIAQLTLVDILFIGVAKNNFSKIDKYLKETRHMVEELKLK
jgi:DNA-binding MurR/RpiR family transcriptional regulator